MADKRTILVTGATGQQGGAVARELLAHGYSIKAMTRKPESDAARELAGRGAGIVRADYDDPASLKSVLKNVWGVFAVQNTWEAGVVKEEEQGKRFAELAKQAGVQLFVYSSVGSAHRATGIPHFDNKWRVEETVRSLGFRYHVVLRPVFFMENFLSPWFRPGIEEGKLIVALAPGTPLQMIALADIGKYGYWALTNYEKLTGRAIDIASDAQTMPETAEILSRAAGRKIEFVRAPIEEVRKASMDYALMLEWFDRVGYDVDIQATSHEAGVSPTSLNDWAAKVFAARMAVAHR
jgi:uncharacterized protein YbjT (DUF2867 family)